MVEKYNIAELMSPYEFKELKTIASAAKKLDYSTSINLAVDDILSGRQLTITELIWCIDGFVMFADNMKQGLKDLKKKVKS